MNFASTSLFYVSGAPDAVSFINRSAPRMVGNPGAPSTTSVSAFQSMSPRRSPTPFTMIATPLSVINDAQRLSVELGRRLKPLAIKGFSEDAGVPIEALPGPPTRISRLAMNNIAPPSGPAFQMPGGQPNPAYQIRTAGAEGLARQAASRAFQVHLRQSAPGHSFKQMINTYA